MEAVNYWTMYVIPIGIQLLIAGTTLYVARRQIINAGVTQFRQQWIDNLRNTLSDYCSLVRSIMLLWDPTNREENKAEVLYKDFEQARFKINMLINPTEKDHIELVRMIDIIHKDTTDPLRVDLKVNRLLDELIKCSQKIFKTEWIRVRDGD